MKTHMSANENHKELAWKPENRCRSKMMRMPDRFFLPDECRDSSKLKFQIQLTCQ